METEKTEIKNIKLEKEAWSSPQVIELEINNTLNQGGYGYDAYSQASGSL